MPVWCDNCDIERGYPGHPFDPCIRCDGEDKPVNCPKCSSAVNTTETGWWCPKCGLWDDSE